MNQIITQSQKIDFLEKVFGEGKPSNGGLNFSVVCPSCKKNKKDSYTKKKLVIRTDNFICHCWVCGFKARSPLSLIKTFFPAYQKEFIEKFANSSNLSYEEDGSEENKNTLDNKCFLPADFKLLALVKENPTDFEKKALNYLRRERKIFLENELWYWKFGVAEGDEDLNNRVILPSFDSEGNVNYWTARAFDKRLKPKYLNPNIPRENIIFNEINIDWSKPLTITEGPFDLIKCNNNATCLLGSALNEKYKLFQKLVENQTPIVLALDEDAKEKSLEIIKNIIQYGNEIKFLQIPKKYGDVGAMSKSMFMELYKNAQPITQENYLSIKIKLMLREEN